MVKQEWQSDDLWAGQRGCSSPRGIFQDDDDEDPVRGAVLFGALLHRLRSHWPRLGPRFPRRLCPVWRPVWEFCFSLITENELQPRGRLLMMDDWTEVDKWDRGKWIGFNTGSKRRAQCPKREFLSSFESDQYEAWSCWKFIENKCGSLIQSQSSLE